MHWRAPHPIFRAKAVGAVAAVAAVAALTGAVLFTGTAGASVGLVGPAVTPSPSDSSTLSLKPVPTTSPTPSPSLTDSPSPTASPSSTLSLKPVPSSSTTTAEPTPTTSSTELTLYGVAEKDYWSGCTVLKTRDYQTYVLLFPKYSTWSAYQFRQAVPLGVPIEVTGPVAYNVATYCFGGTPLQVDTYSTM